jgi:uncharacterized protein (TIGR00661 family)
MGHAIRSRVVLEHLLGRGHEVEIMASGRACDFLRRQFADVHQIHGLHLITAENRVRRGMTLWSNVLAGVTGVPRNISAYFSLISDFAPELVISDFESWTYYYAQVHEIPVLSIDNMQVINRCRHPPEILRDRAVDFELTRAFVKSKLPFCEHYFVTTFFAAEVRKERTSVHPPLLRREILAASPVAGEHVLVYYTGHGFAALERQLRDLGIPCRVYGIRRDIDRDEPDGNLLHRPFGERSFIEDLASARAVIASAGFTLIGEAVYLRKPMLVFPLGKQFEQLLNGRYLAREGYGLTIEDEAGWGQVPVFFERVGEFQARLAGYRQDGNQQLLSALDERLARYD